MQNFPKIWPAISWAKLRLGRHHLILPSLSFRGVCFHVFEKTKQGHCAAILEGFCLFCLPKSLQQLFFSYFSSLLLQSSIFAFFIFFINPFSNNLVVFHYFSNFLSYAAFSFLVLVFLSQRFPKIFPFWTTRCFQILLFSSSFVLLASCFCCSESNSFGPS